MEKELTNYIQHLKWLGWTVISQSQDDEKHEVKFLCNQETITLEFFKKYHPDILIRMQKYAKRMEKQNLNSYNLEFEKLKFTYSSDSLEITTRITNEKNETRLYAEAMSMMSIMKQITQ